MPFLSLFESASPSALSASAVATCPMSSLPDLTPNAVWKPDNGCNVDGDTAVANAVCIADCSPGFIQSGISAYRCNPPLGPSMLWERVSVAQGLTCTGEVGIGGTCVQPNIRVCLIWLLAPHVLHTIDDKRSVTSCT
jgi:hypothetical protein